MIKIYSHYNIGKSTITINNYMKWLESNHFSYALLTEENTSSFVEFIDICKSYNITPIYGLIIDDDVIIFPLNNRGVENMFLFSNGKSIDFKNLIVYSSKKGDRKDNYPKCYSFIEYSSSKIFNCLNITDVEKSILKNTSKLNTNSYVIDNILKESNITLTKNLLLNNIDDAYKILIKKIKKKIVERNIILNDLLKTRLNKELNLIKVKNFSTYFLNYCEIIDFLKINEIEYGYGRGSAPSSLVLYILDITKINPIKYDFTFERFINEKRQDFPDIDLDVDSTRKEEVDNFILNNFKDSFKITTLTTYSLSEIAQFLNKKWNLPDLIIKKISNKQIEEIVKVDSRVGDLYNELLNYQGLIKKTNIHNVGMIITNNNYRKYTTVENRISIFDNKSLEKLGFIKIDILPLSLINKLSRVKQLIKSENLILPKFSLNDDKIFSMINNFELSYLFQIDTKLAKSIIGKFKIESFDDIAILISLNRPGTKELVDKIVKNKSKGIKHSTYGIIIFQEQIINMLRKAYSIDLDTSEILRRALSKKDIVKINNFENWVSVKGYDLEPIKLAKEYASYSFNKSHAYSYAYTLFVQAYYKYYFPKQYFISFGNDSFSLNDFIYLKMKGVKFENFVIREESSVKGSYLYPSVKNLKIDSSVQSALGNKNINTLDELRDEVKINDHDIKMIIFSNLFINKISTSEKYEVDNNNLSSISRLWKFNKEENKISSNYTHKEFLYNQLKYLGFSFNDYYKSNKIIEIEHVEKIKTFYKGTCISNYGRLNFIYFGNKGIEIDKLYYTKNHIDHKFNFNTLIIDDIIKTVD